MMRFFCGALLLLGFADAHGILTSPISRALRQANPNSTQPVDVSASGTCVSGTCEWYTQNTVVPKTTNCDPTKRTMGVSCGSKIPADFPCMPNHGAPWCAPGSAPVYSPCGLFTGGGKELPFGRDMLDLDSTPVMTWKAGSIQDVAWSIIANHGGGYAYRLCPQVAYPDEQCFQTTHLKFVGTTQRIVNSSGFIAATIPANRLSTGTTPAGSEWTVNPVPLEQGMIPAIPGLPQLYGRGPFPYSVVDQLQIPASLPPGNYILSWRWDAEQTKQVWSQCSDVTIEAASGYKVPSAKIASNNAVCTGQSLGLSTTECNAWVELFDALNGHAWDEVKKLAAPSDARLDPCGGLSNTWTKKVICTSTRDYKHITEIYIMGADVVGSIPSTISGLDHLVSLSLVDTNLHGVLPEEIGEMVSLNMIWIDHNPTLGGELPASLSKLTLAVLEAHYSNFTGTLPRLDYENIADCTLYNDRWNSPINLPGNNVFKCPLPAGAEFCGAVCL